MKRRLAHLVASAGLAATAAAGCTGDVGPTGGRPDDGSNPATGGRGSAAAGSTGSRGGGASAGVTGAAPGPSFSCDATSAPPVDRLLRLTESQVRNTLTDLVTFALGDATAAGGVIDGVAALTDFPKDARASMPEDLHGSYRRLDQTLQQRHVDSLYDVEAQLGAALTTSARLGKVVGACATDGMASNDDACVNDFIKRFGARALRRPLTADEVTFYRGVYASTGIDAAGFADVIAALVGSPQFYYRVESGGSPVAGKPGVYALSPFEVASRLSYQFWDTMPDDDLWRAADSGALAKDDVFAAQVDRLLASPRARSTIERFYVDWLKLEDTKPLDTLKDDARFKAFAGADLPSAGLRQSLIDDVVGMVGHYTWTQPAALRDLLTSDQSFARSGELAKIYGVPAWDGKASPPSLGGKRPGLLTRAAFLASASGDTRPIMKGVFIRKTVLCDSIPQPPANAGLNPPMLSSELTTRQVVEGITEAKGSVCAGCHATLINALGFATEGYDALGRARVTQKLYDERGTMTRELPIDTKVVPHVTTDDAATADGAGDLAKLIVASGKADACLARQYFRFTFARWEDEDADGCTLEPLRRASGATDGSLPALLREVAFTPAFRQRRFE